jgi:hypothetical protein
MAGVMTAPASLAAMATATTAEAGPAAETTEAWLWDRVRQVREEQALTTADLAAMGLSAAAAESALARLKGEVRAQRAALDDADGQVRQAESALAATYRRIQDRKRGHH